MNVRLTVGALVFLAAACAAPGKPALPEAETTFVCRDVVREAASYAYAMAKHRDDQRAVMLFPAGPAMAAYEAETKRLRSDGARLLGALAQNDPAASGLTPLAPPPTASLSEALVAEKIGKADACLNSQPEALSACGQKLSEASAYARQHATWREKQMEVMRFASEAAMNAYIARNDYFEVKSTDLAAMRNVIEARYGLADDTQAQVFTGTTGEEAEQRIAGAEACAVPLVQ